MKSALAFDFSKTEEPPPDKVVPVRRPCVVLAEDDREMRMLVATTLRRAGWDVLEAGDGMDLLDCVAWLIEARDDWADCVLVSDIRMPELDGLEVLERLRGLGWAGGIILITAFGDEATHAEARELGATMVIDKPFELDALCEAIRQVQRS
jgi:DNA-binding response OmpR family regulator